eukprot:GHVS01083763.1.p1 GENE.GHVS01083763.1~~GHVS01083763.1.p1  ORF type:complete len:780 (-),score=125.67 GHVS01083763.1:1590-3929(-)
MLWKGEQDKIIEGHHTYIQLPNEHSADDHPFLPPKLIATKKYGATDTTAATNVAESVTPSCPSCASEFLLSFFPVVPCQCAHGIFAVCLLAVPLSFCLVFLWVHLSPSHSKTPQASISHPTLLPSTQISLHHSPQSISSFLHQPLSTPPLLSSQLRNTDHGVVIDAGSHGTRIHLYGWRSRVYDPYHPLTGPVTLPSELFSVAVPLALGNLKEGTQLDGQLEQLFGPLLRNATTALLDMGVVSGRFADIPLFLKATAGMRDLNRDLRGILMASTRRLLLTNKNLNPFLFRPDWGRILSGEEEGMYGWLTVNNALGSLFNAARNTTGAIELGGASAQITFSPVHTSVMEDYNAVHIGDEFIRLYSHSFLGYGWADALTRISTRLALEFVISSFRRHRKHDSIVRLYPTTAILAAASHEKKKTKDEIPQTIQFSLNHPCYPIGYKFSFPVPAVSVPDSAHYFVDIGRKQLDLYKRVVLSRMHILRRSKRSTLNKEKDGGRKKTGGERVEEVGLDVTFTGTSDYHQCYALARKLFRDEPCFINSCSFNGVYQPRLLDSQFIAFGQFYKAQQALGLPEHPSLEMWRHSTKRAFKLSLETLRKNHRRGQYASFDEGGLHNMCWKCLWAFAVLHDGFGFELDTTAIHFADTLPPSNVAPDWALGSMLYEVNFFPWKVPISRYEGPFVWALAVALLMLLICVMLCGQILFLRKALRIQNEWPPEDYTDEPCIARRSTVPSYRARSRSAERMDGAISSSAKGEEGYERTPSRSAVRMEINALEQHLF